MIIFYPIVIFLCNSRFFFSHVILLYLIVFEYCDSWFLFDIRILRPYFLRLTKYIPSQLVYLIS